MGQKGLDDFTQALITELKTSVEAGAPRWAIRGPLGLEPHPPILTLSPDHGTIVKITVTSPGGATTGLSDHPTNAGTTPKDNLFQYRLSRYCGPPALQGFQVPLPVGMLQMQAVDLWGPLCINLVGTAHCGANQVGCRQGLPAEGPHSFEQDRHARHGAVSLRACQVR